MVPILYHISVIICFNAGCYHSPQQPLDPQINGGLPFPGHQ